MHYKLSQEIIGMSVAGNWEDAKQEWSYEYIYEEPGETCLCGHHPIKNVCVISNVKNGNVAEVGNCCVKKFLGIEVGELILANISKLKKDKTKGLSKEIIHYLYDKGVISEFEKSFSYDTALKRKLTEKQMLVRLKVNAKFLNYVENKSSIKKKVISIYYWIEKRGLDRYNMIWSILKQYKNKKTLTDKQLAVLQSFMLKNDIE